MSILHHIKKGMLLLSSIKSPLRSTILKYRRSINSTGILYLTFKNGPLEKTCYRAGITSVGLECNNVSVNERFLEVS